MDRAAVPLGVEHAPTITSRDDGRRAGWSIGGAYEQRGRSGGGIDREVSARPRAFDPDEALRFDGNRPIGRTAHAGMPAGVRLMQSQQPHARNPTSSVGGNAVWQLHLWVVDVT